MTNARPKSKSKAQNLGVYDRPQKAGISAVEVIAVALSAFWLLGSAVFFLGMNGGEIFSPDNISQLTFVMTLMSVFLPVAVIWVAASAARSSRIVREESRRLQTAVDAMRQTYVADQQGRNMALQPSVERKLEEIATAARGAETAVASFTSQRAISEPQPVRKEAPTTAPDEQAGLPLGTPVEQITPPLTRSDFIRALNFPETADDKEGFAALRRALSDRKIGGLVRASQDILTLLSQDGIYMDDLRPDRARPELWRRFAEGERGRQVAALGGIRDRSSLALAAGRMRKDPIFKDAAHHFLRRFDQAFIEFVETASDADIDELSQTRTARAFMLMGRVMGIFD